MRVAYKWTITSTKVAYITGSGANFNEPYICDINTCVPNDESVANLASLMTESEYKTNFEKMVLLLKNDSDGKYYSLYPYEYYFNAEDNDCLTSLDTGITINVEAQTKTLGCNEEATATITTAGTKDTQTVSFTFGIPKGCQGPQGESGSQGPQGPQGPRGPQGAPGSSNVTAYRTFFIYKNSDTRPDTPVGGTFYVDASENGGGHLEAPDGWSTDNNSDGTIWMSNGTFNISNGDQVGTWSTPIKLSSGGSGNIGVDVRTTEFIYKRTSEYPIDGTIAAPTQNDKTVDDYVPTAEGWTDNPQGISPDYKCEWMCYRDYGETEWGDWQGPTLWSRWGENGMDGDGVQYIFCNKSATLVNIPSPNQIDIDSDQYQEIGEYAGVEYVPTGWTDDPQGVSESNPVEWVSQRKYRNGKWGEFSTPSVWAKLGEQGVSGISYRVKYQAFPSTGVTIEGTDEIQIAPSVNKTNANPGSAWSDALPSYSSDENIWATAAYLDYKNELATTVAEYGWSDPWIVTGIEGRPGTPPNYKTYVFAKNDYQPNPPVTGVTADNPGVSSANDPSNPSKTVTWVDYPDTADGIWWSCVGVVRGVDDIVEEWGTPQKVTGIDGDAKDGKWTEFRFAYSNTTKYPAFDKTARIPGTSWLTNPTDADKPETIVSVWMTWATITPDNLLEGEWCAPTKINGEQGPQGNTGPAGPQGPGGIMGPSGIPGVSFVMQYAVGTETEVTGEWKDTVPDNTELTGNTLYIWCRQGSKVYYYDENNEIAYRIEYGSPFRLSGTNGLNGIGKKGQIVYPAGVYDPSVVYVTDEFKAPYVLDTSDGQFYVLNAIMEWDGTNEQYNRTPSQDYADNNGAYWLKIDAFEAVYAKVGIIANGLIGSAVFNGDYMFSQQGVDENGLPTTNYQNFNPDDPYGESATFKPNICINFKTGEAWFAHGLIRFSDSGMSFTTSGSTTTIDELSSSVTTNSTKIEQTKKEVALKASQTELTSVRNEVGGLTTRMTEAESEIEINAEGIASTVERISAIVEDVPMDGFINDIIQYYSAYGGLMMSYNDGTDRNFRCSINLGARKKGDVIRITNPDGIIAYILACDGDTAAAQALATKHNVNITDQTLLGVCLQASGNEYVSPITYTPSIEMVLEQDAPIVFIQIKDNYRNKWENSTVTIISERYSAQSRIEQSADNIKLAVNDCGINIDSKTISLSAENTIVSGDLSVQKVKCYYPEPNQEFAMSTFNGNGNGTIVYYYPLYYPDTKNQIPMREDIFNYDSSGNTTGMTTIYYDRNGNPIWKLGENGLTMLSSYWHLIGFDLMYISGNTSTALTELQEKAKSAAADPDNQDLSRYISTKSAFTRFMTNETKYNDYKYRVASSYYESKDPTTVNNWFKGLIVTSFSHYKNKGNAGMIIYSIYECTYIECKDFANTWSPEITFYVDQFGNTYNSDSEFPEI